MQRAVERSVGTERLEHAGVAAHRAHGGVDAPGAKARQVDATEHVPLARIPPPLGIDDDVAVAVDQERARGHRVSDPARQRVAAILGAPIGVLDLGARAAYPAEA